MAVTNQIPIGSFIGNGVATVFPFAYYIAAASDLVVKLDGVTLAMGLDYTVSGAGNPSGGTVTMTVAPAIGARLAHYRDTALTRATDYQDNGDLLADVLNLDFDRLWFALQEIFSGGKGSPTAVRVPAGETIEELPPALARANRLLGFGSSGELLPQLPAAGSATELAMDLVSTATGKGDALVAVSQPFTGALARTQHDKNIDTGLYAEDFRAVSDPDDTLSIQRVLNLGRTCLLRANKTYTVQNLVGVAGTGLICPGGRAILNVVAGADKWGIQIDCDRFTLKGVNFNGGNTTDFKSFPAAAIGTRCGIIVGAPFDTGRNLREISISDCDLYGFDKAGLWGREVMFGATTFGKKTSLHNISAYTCYYGIWYDERFEYVCTTNSYAYECLRGFYVQGGNNSFTGCQSNWCYDNFMLEFGYNDGHGQAVGCSFNHAFGGHNIFAKNVANGFTFVGCSMWFGNVEILGSYGICITDSVLANLVVNINGGGVNNVDNNYFVVAVSTAFVGNCFTTFRRNRDTYFATTANQDVNYGDLWMVARASSAIGVLQTNTTAAEFPLTYGTKKWMGKDLAALQVGQRAVIQKTGIVKTYVSIVFTTAAAIQTVKMKLRRFDRTAVTMLEELETAVYCPASTTGLSIERAVEWEFEWGEQIQIQLWTTSATGFTPTAIDVRHSLVY